MLYTQTSLSLVYNLERVSKSLHCYCATYQFGIVAWLRLEPNSYSTKLYSLHRRCSFGPVAVALGQLSESFVLSPLYCSLELVAAKCRCRCVLDVQLWLKIWEWRYYPVLIRSWRCAAGAVLWAVLCAMSEVVMMCAESPLQVGCQWTGVDQSGCSPQEAPSFTLVAREFVLNVLGCLETY